MKPVLVIKQRANDWIVFFQADPTTWEAGRTVEEAVGKLVVTYSIVGPEVCPFIIERNDE